MISSWNSGVTRLISQVCYYVNGNTYIRTATLCAEIFYNGFRHWKSWVVKITTLSHWWSESCHYGNLKFSANARQLGSPHEETRAPFNLMMWSYQYRKSHCGYKTILRPSYVYNRISYTGKTTSLYWIGTQYVRPVSQVISSGMECSKAVHYDEWSEVISFV